MFPLGTRAAPERLPAAARVRAALPRAGAGVPRRRPGVRRRADRAGQRGRWRRPAHRTSAPSPGSSRPRELPDGRWALGTVGTRRIRVREWLPDDPYPRAEVDDWPEPELTDAATAELAGSVAELMSSLRRVLARRAELGEPAAPATIELADDPVLASYQAAAVAPLGPADQQQLLEQPDAAARIARLAELLAEEETFLAQRLALEQPTTIRQRSSPEQCLRQREYRDTPCPFAEGEPLEPTVPDRGPTWPSRRPSARSRPSCSSC